MRGPAVSRDPEWISYVAAAEIIGVSTGTVRNLIRSGDLVHRNGPRRFPSVLRRSAEECRERRHIERQAALAVRAAETAAKGPPADGQIWLSIPEAAHVLGVTRNRVSQMVHADKVPATRHGHRWWIQRTHAEILSAVRAVRLSTNVPGHS